MATDGTNQPTPALITEIKAIVARAKSGDEAAVPELRERLDRHPELWQRYGDLGAQAERTWITLAAGANLHLRECMIRFTEAQRTELTRPGAAPAEKMLVDIVVACGLQLHYFAALEVNVIEAKESPKVHQWWAKRHAQAQRAFQSALSHLVTMQKLFPIPVAQVATPVAVAEPEAVPASIRTAVPPSPVTVPVESGPELSTFQATGWSARPEEVARATNTVTDRS